MVKQTNNAEETQQFASEFSKKFKDQGGIIALSGDLGAGKTTFVQGFAQGLNITDKIISPTFVLMRQHRFGQDRMLYHIDLYRLTDNPDITNLGIKDLLEETHDIVLIEWAEKIKVQLPSNTIFINITKPSENSRQIEISDTIN